MVGHDVPKRAVTIGRNTHDDCYINEKRVPIAELGKYPPAISESNADQLNGHCETILCFDKDDQPMGYLLQ